MASIVIPLLAVAALVAGIGWLAKRAGVKRLLPRRSEHLEVVESLVIGPKRTLTLVRCGDQVLLLGLGEHEISALGTFPASLVATPDVLAAGQPRPPSTFANLFGGLVKK